MLQPTPARTPCTDGVLSRHRNAPTLSVLARDGINSSHVCCLRIRLARSPKRALRELQRGLKSMLPPSRPPPRRHKSFRNLQQLKQHLQQHHNLQFCNICLEGRKVKLF
jgi:hypothetical protein